MYTYDILSSCIIEFDIYIYIYMKLSTYKLFTSNLYVTAGRAILFKDGYLCVEENAQGWMRFVVTNGISFDHHLLSCLFPFFFLKDRYSIMTSKSWHHDYEVVVDLERSLTLLVVTTIFFYNMSVVLIGPAVDRSATFVDVTYCIDDFLLIDTMYFDITDKSPDTSSAVVIVVSIKYLSFRQYRHRSWTPRDETDTPCNVRIRIFSGGQKNTLVSLMSQSEKKKDL